MSQAVAMGYSTLHAGDMVRVLSRDTFNGKVGKVDYITPDENWYQVRFVGQYGSDVVPFRRHELMRVS